MAVLWLGACCIVFIACVVGTVGEIVAGHWGAAICAALPTGMFLWLVIMLTIASAKEIH